jgi:hypothetical protein
MSTGSNEPKIHKSSASIGNNGLKLNFEGEQYKGLPVLDTRAEINAGTLCWVTWEDRIKLTEELQAVIDKYLI